VLLGQPHMYQLNYLAHWIGYASFNKMPHGRVSVMRARNWYELV